MNSKIFVVLVTFFSFGCSTLYYSAWEKLGREKRDLLKSNVASVKDDQSDVQKGFEDALSHIKAAYGLQAGKLQDVYEQLKSDHADAKERAENLTKRINKIETIGHDLFEEWSGEIKRMNNPQYKRDSESKLKSSKQRFSVLMTTLRASEKKIPPVLQKLEDQVLYLKHNLNAAAMGAFKTEGASIEKEIKILTADMEKSIQASDSFIKTLDESK